VCDGMGGHAGGREASTLALQTILETFAAAPPEGRGVDVLREAIALANQRVFSMSPGSVQLQQKAGQHGRPGSTIVAVLLSSSGAEVAHVGDSRAYLVHGSQIFQVTRDHSMVQELVDAGFLTPAQAATHPNANQITRALGMQPEVDVEVRAQPLQLIAGDAFVLCSDGLSDLVEPPEILQIVGSAPAAQAAGQLVDLANARGGHDNVTVAILRAREGTATQATAVLPTVNQTAPPDRSLVETLPAEGVRVTIPDRAPPTEHQAVAPGMVIGPRFQSEPPPSSEVPRARRGMPASVLVGLALAGIAILILIAILYIHFTTEHHRRHETPFPLEPPSSADAASEAGAP